MHHPYSILTIYTCIHYTSKPINEVRFATRFDRSRLTSGNVQCHFYLPQINSWVSGGLPSNCAAHPIDMLTIPNPRMNLSADCLFRVNYAHFFPSNIHKKVIRTSSDWWYGCESFINTHTQTHLMAIEWMHIAHAMIGRFVGCMPYVVVWVNSWMYSFESNARHTHNAECSKNWTQTHLTSHSVDRVENGNDTSFFILFYIFPHCFWHTKTTSIHEWALFIHLLSRCSYSKTVFSIWNTNLQIRTIFM